ncbi:MAG TPA: hypothetical protein VJJ47_04065 [Candidatus Paceibacterota bacterium]
MPTDDQPTGNGFEGDSEAPRRSIRDIPIPPHRRREAGEPAARPAMDGVRAAKPAQRPAPPPGEPIGAATDSATYPPKSYYQMSEDESYRAPRRPGRYRRLLKILAIVVVAAAVFLVATWHSAVVTVVEKHAEKSLALKLGLSPEGGTIATGSIAFRSADVSDSASQTLAATGEAAVKTKATGVITIYNAYSSADQPLVKNTRFETPTGLVFRIDQPTVVPGQKKGADGTTTPGKVTAKVAADQPGEQYNVGPIARFTVPGFKGQPQYDGFYASSEAPMQGGFDGIQKVPDPKEEAAAVDRLTQALQGKLAAAAASSTGAEYVAFVVPGTFAVHSTSREPAEDAGKVTVTVEAAARAVAVRRQDLAEEIAEAAMPTYVRGTGGRVDDFAAVRGMPEGADTPTALALSGTAKVTWTVDPVEVAEALLGRPLTEVSQIAAQFPGAESFTPVVRPFWRSSFPDSVGKIRVTVSASGADN